jgi:predicted nuclease of predicted toxin-antitoxin system
LDFGVILAQTNATSPSVALLRLADVDPVTAGARVVAALRACTRELAEGAILTIDDNRHRVRQLPLRVESPET